MGACHSLIDGPWPLANNQATKVLDVQFEFYLDVKPLMISQWRK